MLRTKDLTFSYQPETPGFHFPDFRVAAGETMLVLGESGKGKTTLLHLLAGILRPSAGEVWVGNIGLSKLKGAQLDRFRGRKIGLMLQRPHFLPALSLEENLLLAPWLAGVSQNETRMNEIAERLGILGLMHKKTYQLSQGEQQRATLARALINKPDVILADEPTSALDDKHCDSVAALLKEAAIVTGAALIVVTHDNRLKRLFRNHLTLS